MGEVVFIGRDRELRLIKGYIRQRKNVMIYGIKGVGKTSLVRKIADGKKNRILYSQKSRTLKETLVNLVSCRMDDMKNNINPMSRENVAVLKKLLYKILAEPLSCIILDHIGCVTPKYYSFLEYLTMERSIPLIMLSRGLGEEFIGHHLGMMMYDFMKVEIRNFDRVTTYKLVDTLINRMGINIVNQEKFAQDVFRYSCGNPAVITRICLMAENEKYQRKGFLDAKLIDLDRQINEMWLSYVR